jgi:hypothetical protein
MNRVWGRQLGNTMQSSPNDVPPCDCPEPGWCARHGIHKTEHWHRLCQSRADYRKQWDDGVGPGQILTPQPGAVKPVKDGWGDHVTTWLKNIGITEERYKDIKTKFGLPPTCNCSKRREWLNRVGEWWNGRNE